MTVKTSAENRVYQLIEEEIVTMRFPPGELLSEARLARRYGVSRSPVKNALIRLEQKGLVEIRPQVGTIVSEFSTARARDICDLRLLLEPYAAGLAARNMDEADAAALCEQYAAVERCEGDAERVRQAIFAADALVHETVLRLCGNDAIAQSLALHRAQTRRIQMANAELGDRLVLSGRELGAIVAALCARDSDAAEHAMRRHIEGIKAAAAHLGNTQ